MTPLLVLTTFPSVESAREAARILIDEQLAACVSILPKVESLYRWQEKVETAEEVLCLCKTSAERWLNVQNRLKSLHPYEVPEIIALPVAEGWPPYLQWLAEQVQPPMNLS